MKNKLAYIEMISKDVVENASIFIKNYNDDKNKGRYSNFTNYRDGNHGKCAIARKITLLRRELLNLEQMINNT